MIADIRWNENPVYLHIDQATSDQKRTEKEELKEQADSTQTSRPIKNRIWNFLNKKNAEMIACWMLASIIALAAIAAVAGAIGGLVTLTVFFPHVMIPIYCVVGGGILLSGGLLGLMAAGFAAGSGDRRRQ